MKVSYFVQISYFVQVYKFRIKFGSGLPVPYFVQVCKFCSLSQFVVSYFVQGYLDKSLFFFQMVMP